MRAMPRLFFTALVCCAVPAFAQDGKPSAPAAAPAAAPAVEELPPEVVALVELDQRLARLHGETDIGGVAAIEVPAEFDFIGPADAQAVLEAWGNPPDPTVLGAVLPAGGQIYDPAVWAAILTFEELGYVSDEDADSINYDELLVSMTEGTVADSEQRVAQGYPSIALVGWAEPPHYDEATHVLYWAREFEFNADPVHDLNYDVRILGRRGVLSLNAVGSMTLLQEVRPAMATVMGITRFNQGEQYVDFDPNIDRVAEVGLAALIGGTVLAKTGLLKGILLGLVAFKKLIFAGIIGVVAFAGKLFGKKPSTNAPTPPPGA